MNELHTGIDELTVEHIKENLNTKIIGNEVCVYDSVTSTMDIARDKIHNNVIEGYTIFAEQQTNGRGRRGKVWLASSNKGLLFTVILKPEIKPDYNCFLMGFASIAITEAIKHLYNIDANVKWPNDIIINNRKVAGILVEAHGSYKEELTFSIGLGVNVNTAKDELPVKTSIPTTSLNIETGRDLNRLVLAQTILQSMDTWYSYLKDGEYDFIRQRWLKLCSGFNGKLYLNEGDNEYSGKLVDISPKGDVITLELDNNIKRSFKSEYVTLSE